MSFARFTRWNLVLVGCVVWGSCQPTPPEVVPSSPQPFLSTDGDKIIDAPNVVVNRYCSLAQDVVNGATQLQVGISGIQALLPLSVGDLLLVVQMQGAQAVTLPPTTAMHGNVLTLGGAGLFDWVRVTSWDENTGLLRIDGEVTPLRHSYRASAHTQVVRVPRYNRLVVQAGASITTPPWDGSTGGVVAVQAYQVQLDGNIEATGKGFRGGKVDDVSTVSNMTTVYASLQAGDGAEKGESVIGFATEYDALGGHFGRGSIANGGGGGGPYRSGGGGGGHAAVGAVAWTGQGIRTGHPAWNVAGECGGVCAVSSGGGRGGYSQSTLGGAASTTGPNNAVWGGNSRREIGGLGGRPLDGIDPQERLFVGGGGGAGDRSGAITAQTTGRGGAGGGLVYVVAASIQGSGSLAAHGEPGESTWISDANQGAGGGGAGGSVVTRAVHWQGLQMTAQGGVGGNQTATSPASIEADGPGGGGGGGYIAAVGGVPAAHYVSGAPGGTSGSSVMTAAGTGFPANGASQGADGKAETGLSLMADLSVTVEPSVPTLPLPNDSFDFVVRVTNQGPDFVENASLQGVLTPAYPTVHWQCQTPQVPFAQCNAAMGTGNLSSQVSLAPGAALTFLVRVQIPSYVIQDTVSYQASIAKPAGVQDANSANDQASLTMSPPANVQIALLPQFNSLPDPQPLQYHIPIENLGPYCAENLQTTVQVSNGWSIAEPKGEGWTCTSMTQSQVICTLPKLAVREKTQISFGVVSVSPNPTDLTVQANLTTQTFDPQVSNNVASDTWDKNRLPTTVAGGALQCNAGNAPLTTDGLWLYGLLLLGSLGTLRRAIFNKLKRLVSKPHGFLMVVLVVGWLGGASRAHADGFQINRFEPTTAGEPSMMVNHPWYTPSFSVAAGLTLNYAYNPLVFGNVLPDGSFVRTKVLLGHQFLGHINLAASWANRVTVSASLPVTLVEAGESLAGIRPVDNIAAGDPRFGVRVRLWGDPYENPFSIHLGADLWIPTRSSFSQVGDSNVRFMPRLMMGGVAKRVLWSLDLGGSYRPDSTIGMGLPFPYNTMGSQFHVGAALAYRDKVRGFSVGPELVFDTVLTQGVAFQRAASSLEIAVVSAHYQVLNQLQLGVTLSVGALQNGNAGSPEVRGLFSVAYTPPRKEQKKVPAVPEPNECLPPEKQPDRDGDGVPDALDECPDENKDGPDTKNMCLVRGVDKGGHPSEMHRGCPDRDTDCDGVYDSKDFCEKIPMGAHPNLLDPLKFGCPLGDLDGDGVLDDKDQCPDVPEGPRANRKRPGCPLAPGEDDCPKVQVHSSNLGLSEQILFETNKDIIRPVSYPLLQDVANALQQHPEIIKVAIDGHTDNRRTPMGNQLLSQKRARSVMKWLVEQGKIEPTRLMARGFGQSRPIADNKTEEGQRLNRRVEFNILEKKELQPGSPAAP